MKYIHVKNWDRYQHPDTKRGERAMPWIKSYTKQLSELSYLELSFSDRGVLDSLRLQYALNQAEGVQYSRGSLAKLLGITPRPEQIERLNQAGLIVITASKLLAESLQDAGLDLDLDKDKDKYLATPSREDVSSVSQSAPVQATGAGDVEQQLAAGVERERGADDADGDIVLPSSSKASTASATSSSSRPRDEVWDELQRLFGAVVEKTSAHGARNRAVKDLRAYGATAELVRLAARRWASLYPSATLTDSAIAKHWPQLTAGARQSSGAAACEGCGVGGGFHGADCPTVAEAPPGDLERFLHEQDDEEVA